MGANNKNPQRQKCGDIFINIKTIRNRAKVFTFHCTLCSIDCDQLKKFSKHLESHFDYYEDDPVSGELVKNKNLLLEAEEIKVEADILTDSPNNARNNGVVGYEDPLEPRKFYEDEMVSSINIKTEVEDVERYEDVCNETACNVNISTVEATEMFDDSKKGIDKLNTFELDDYNSDDFSEYSSLSDLDVEKELEISNNVNQSNGVLMKGNSDMSERKKKTIKEKNKNCQNKSSVSNSPKRRSKVINESILPILIQKYKQCEILWQVDDIAFGIKNKKYEMYVKIAEALQQEANEVMSLEDINYHINHLNELYSKDKEQDLKSKIEKKKFVPEYKHYNEMSFLSSSQGPFVCSICNEMLPKHRSLCYHMAQHNDTQPFQCPSCDLMFTNYHRYLVHKKRHLGIHDFHCNICGKGYMFKNDLEWHVTSHTGDKPYLCQICGTGFRARHGYDNHVRRHEERFRYECHICKRGFNQLHALNNHVKSHLNIRDIICKICGKGFVHRQYLKRHELIHGKEKRYKCNECGKAFFQPCGLRSHRKNHHS